MKTRWLYIAKGFLIMLMLGTVYSWSVFRQPLESLYGIGTALSGLPYMVALMSYALLMMLTGRVMHKYEPRHLIHFGAALVALGWGLSAIAPNILALTLTYGLITGSGVGIVYGVPMAIAAQWYPDRKGLAVGLVLVGFGLSPLITAPLARWLVDQGGVQTTFLVLGLVFGILLFLLGLGMKMPDTHKGHSQGQGQGQAPRMTKSLWALYINFLLGTLIGLTLIGKTSTIGLAMLDSSASEMAIWVSVFALFNGVGRPIFGYLTDRTSPKTAMLLAYGLVILASITLLVPLPGVSKTLPFALAFGLYWMSLGAWLAIAPAATLKIVGIEAYSRTYGVIFTAYGIGAVLGTASAGVLLDWFGDYRLIIGSILGLGLIGSLWTYFNIKLPGEA